MREYKYNIYLDDRNEPTAAEAKPFEPVFARDAQIIVKTPDSYIYPGTDAELERLLERAAIEAYQAGKFETTVFTV